MRAIVNVQGAGACGPPVLPTRLRRYGRTFDPLEGLRPSHRRCCEAPSHPEATSARIDGGTHPARAVCQEKGQERCQASSPTGVTLRSLTEGK